MPNANSLPLAFSRRTDHPGSARSSNRGGWRELLAEAWNVATSRRGLVDIDDRMLQDLGITRAQANFELDRPIWRWFR